MSCTTIKTQKERTQMYLLNTEPYWHEQLLISLVMTSQTREDLQIALQDLNLKS